MTVISALPYPAHQTDSINTESQRVKPEARTAMAAQVTRVLNMRSPEWIASKNDPNSGLDCLNRAAPLISIDQESCSRPANNLYRSNCYVKVDEDYSVADIFGTKP